MSHRVPTARVGVFKPGARRPVGRVGRPFRPATRSTGPRPWISWLSASIGFCVSSERTSCTSRNALQCNACSDLDVPRRRCHVGRSLRRSGHVYVFSQAQIGQQEGLCQGLQSRFQADQSQEHGQQADAGRLAVVRSAIEPGQRARRNAQLIPLLSTVPTDTEVSEVQWSRRAPEASPGRGCRGEAPCGK